MNAVTTMPHSLTLAVSLTLLATPTGAQNPPGEAPAINPPRITQAMIASGSLPLRAIRTPRPAHVRDAIQQARWLRRRSDDTAAAPTMPGGRPTLQNNGTFLRVNGLDSQTCMECHSIMSAAQVPFRFGHRRDRWSKQQRTRGPHRHRRRRFAAATALRASTGRFINPPFLFGSGRRRIGRQGDDDRATGAEEAGNAKARHCGSVAGQGASILASSSTSAEPSTHRASWVSTMILVVRPFGRKGEFRDHTRVRRRWRCSFTSGWSPSRWSARERRQRR